MDVSASDPHSGLAQSRGVPSITVHVSIRSPHAETLRHTGKTRHGNTIRALDLGDDTMSRDSDGQCGKEGDRVTHFEVEGIGILATIQEKVMHG